MELDAVFTDVQCNNQEHKYKEEARPFHKVINKKSTKIINDVPILTVKKLLVHVPKQDKNANITNCNLPDLNLK